MDSDGKEVIKVGTQESKAVGKEMKHNVKCSKNCSNWQIDKRGKIRTSQVHTV